MAPNRKAATRPESRGRGPTPSEKPRKTILSRQKRKTADSTDGESRAKNGLGLRGPDRTHDNRTIIEALRASAGVVAAAAMKLRVARQTVHHWIAHDPELQEAQVTIKEELIDLAEGQLWKKVREGSERSIHYVLDRLAKDRGYVTKHQVEGPNGGPVPVKAEFRGQPTADLKAQAELLAKAAEALAGAVG